MNHTEIIKTKYCNPAIGFKSAGSMHDKLKQYGITKEEITDFIKNQSAQQQFAQTPHIKHYHPITSNDKWNDNTPWFDHWNLIYTNIKHLNNVIT